MRTAQQKALLATLVTMLLWSFTFPASKAVLPYFRPEEVVVLRNLASFSFYLLLFAAGVFTLPKRRDLPALFVLGVVGIAVYQLLFVHGIGRVAAGAAAMIFVAIPVFTSLLARIFLGEKLSKRAWCGIGVGFIGVTLIALSKGAEGELAGYLLLVLSTFSVSVYFVFQKRFFNRYSPLAMTSYTNIVGALPLVYFLPQATGAALQAPVEALVWIAMMGVCSSGVGYLLWFYAMSKLPAGIVSSFMFLQPVFVTVIAWFWLFEIPTVQAFIGGGIVLLGVTLVLVPSRRVVPQH